MLSLKIIFFFFETTRKKQINEQLNLNGTSQKK